MKQPELVTTAKSPRFQLGNLYITPGASEAIGSLQADPFELFYRHACGEWESLCLADKQANEDALRYGSRILSAYELTPSMDVEGTTEPVKVWIITEADRSITTMLLPSEY